MEECKSEQRKKKPRVNADVRKECCNSDWIRLCMKQAGLIWGIHFV